MAYKDPEKRKARRAAWYKANSEKKKASSAAWRKANPEKLKAIRKAALVKEKAYRKANLEKRRAYVAKYRKANPEKAKLAEARKNNPGLPQELLAVIVMKNMIRKEIRNQTNQTT